jgi:dodecin
MRRLLLLAQRISGRRGVLRSQAGDAGEMSDHVYKSIEITGSSPDGVTQAIERAVAKASQSLRGLDWFEVTEIRGHIEEGNIAHYQVTLKVGFRLED